MAEVKRTNSTRRITWSFVVLTVIFLSILLLLVGVLMDVRDLSTKTAKLSKATAHLSVENSKRIREIQKSRVRSCQTTYNGVRNVFRPFLPKHPTGTLRKRIEKFNRVVNRLVHGCINQTNPRVEAP